MPEVEASAAAAPAGAAGDWSLKHRLQRRLTVLLVLLWAAASALVGGVVWHGTTQVLDSALQETAERLLLITGRAGDAIDTPAEQAELGAHAEFVVYQIYDAQGRLRLRSDGAPLAPLSPGAHQPPPGGVDSEGPWRVYTLDLPDGRRAQVAETVAHRHRVLWTSLGGLLLMPLALLPLVALAARWAVDHGFAALEPTRRMLARRSPQDLQPLSAGAAPVELLPWIAAINTVLARARALVDSERTFAANTAHELRTPLAAAMAQAQRLQQACGAEPAQQAAAAALVRQLDRLARLAARLLQLARIDAGLTLRRAPVDLGQLALLVADDFAEAQRSGQLQLAVAAAPATVSGDVDALGIALRNLIDNALKHGGPQARVTLRLDGASLTVEDTGAGVPAGQLAQLTRPFSRAAAAGTDGCGLGLALVDAIARQSGAELRLQSPLPGRRDGFGATLCFSSSHMAAPGQGG